MRTTEKVNLLKSRNGEDNRSLYERCKLATEVMADLEYIEEAHGGSDVLALDYLTDNCFSALKNVGGWVTAGALIELYKAFPEEQQWQERKYNLQVMRDELREKVEDIPPRQTRNWKQLYEELREKYEELRDKYDELRDKYDELRGKLEEKAEEVAVRG
jgi:hypothetical protein